MKRVDVDMDSSELSASTASNTTLPHLEATDAKRALNKNERRRKEARKLKRKAREKEEQRLEEKKQRKEERRLKREARRKR